MLNHQPVMLNQATQNSSILKTWLNGIQKVGFDATDVEGSCTVMMCTHAWIVVQLLSTSTVGKCIMTAAPHALSEHGFA